MPLITVEYNAITDNEVRYSVISTIEVEYNGRNKIQIYIPWLK